MTEASQTIDKNTDSRVYPYRKYLDIRDEHGPLVRTENGDWIALGYDLINSLLRDPRFVTMDPVENGVDQALAGRNRLLQFFMRPVMRVVLHRHQFLNMVRLWLVMNDPPTHTRLRKIAQQAFTPKAIRDLTPVIEEVTNELLDSLEEKEEVDIIADFALPLPIAMISAIIGIPNKGKDLFNNWSQDILKGFAPSPDSYDTVKQAVKAQSEVKEFLSAIIEERESQPENDVISLMLEARKSDSELTMSNDEIIANIVLLLIAGHETTVNLIGNTMHAFLTHPKQYDSIKSNPDLLEKAIEESLRFDTPITAIPRIATEDMTLNGKELKKGDRVHLSLYAANYDEQIFKDSLSFNINRKNSKKHVSFGQGIHYCLGAPLARMEAEIAFREIMKRFPDMKLTGEQLERNKSFGFNGFKELPVKLR